MFHISQLFTDLLISFTILNAQNFYHTLSQICKGLNFCAGLTQW
jgi:hypothetical protein